MRSLKDITARVQAMLDRVSASSHTANVLVSAGRTVAVGVKLMVQDTRQIIADRDVSKPTYRMLARTRRTKRDLLVGLPFAIYFNIPFIGNTFLLVAIFAPSVLPICWRSHRQRVRDMTQFEKNGSPGPIMRLMPSALQASVEAKRREYLAAEDRLLPAEVDSLTQRECEEALHDRRIPLGSLLDWEKLPYYNQDGENGRSLPLSTQPVQEVRKRLKRYLATKHT